jgi:hypothetical protein
VIFSDRNVTITGGARARWNRGRHCEQRSRRHWVHTWHPIFRHRTTHKANHSLSHLGFRVDSSERIDVRARDISPERPRKGEGSLKSAKRSSSTGGGGPCTSWRPSGRIRGSRQERCPGGVPGAESNMGAANVYVPTKPTNNFMLTSVLSASDATAGDAFGTSVAVADAKESVALIGAVGHGQRTWQWPRR